MSTPSSVVVVPDLDAGVQGVLAGDLESGGAGLGDERGAAAVAACSFSRYWNAIGVGSLSKGIPRVSA